MNVSNPFALRVSLLLMFVQVELLLSTTRFAVRPRNLLIFDDTKIAVLVAARDQITQVSRQLDVDELGFRLPFCLINVAAIISRSDESLDAGYLSP